MDEDAIVDEILERAESQGADSLLELSVASAAPELYDAACEVLGGWDAALAVALRRSLEGDDGDSNGGGSVSETIHRSVGKSAREPIFVSAEKGAIFRIEPGTELAVGEALEAFDTPPGSGAVAHLGHLGDPEGVVLFSNEGHYFALDPRMIPKWKGADQIRRLENVLEMERGEFIEFFLPRRALYEGRIVHVTAQGKGKATEASEFEYAMDHEPRLAYLLDEGDAPVAVMAVREGTGVFCASAHGRGIHFPDDELRSMGARAKGVKVMDVGEEHNEVVGAFPTRRVEQVAIVTRDGYGKRVDFSEFRQQGRAGAGMQLARLNKGDRLVGAAPCRPVDDLVVATSAGRIRRFPAGTFRRLGRPAKGDRRIELEDSERIVAFESLPCGSE